MATRWAYAAAVLLLTLSTWPPAEARADFLESPRQCLQPARALAVTVEEATLVKIIRRSQVTAYRMDILNSDLINAANAFFQAPRPIPLSPGQFDELIDLFNSEFAPALARVFRAFVDKEDIFLVSLDNLTLRATIRRLLRAIVEKVGRYDRELREGGGLPGARVSEIETKSDALRAAIANAKKAYQL